MSEIVPAATADPTSVSMEKPPVKKRAKKSDSLTDASRKTPNLSLSKLITKVLSGSHDRIGMSLTALKKALATAGYDVEKKNNRIKLGLKTLVNNGTVVQTRGTGASGSFKLSKKPAPEPKKNKVKRTAKTKKLVLEGDSDSPKSAKTNKKAKQAALARKKGDRGHRKAKGANLKQQCKSPAKSRARIPMTGRPKLTKQKTNPRKAAPKK